tara:strand:- start:795 stop:953 length:159 start_codon:yes stop_codon:yes gene_type:complete
MNHDPLNQEQRGRRNYNFVAAEHGHGGILLPLPIYIGIEDTKLEQKSGTKQS